MSRIVAASSRFTARAKALGLIDSITAFEARLERRGLGGSRPIGKSALYLVDLSPPWVVVFYYEVLAPDTSILLLTDLVSVEDEAYAQLLGRLIKFSRSDTRREYLAEDEALLGELRERVRQLGQLEDSKGGRIDQHVRRLTETLKSILGSLSRIEPRHLPKLDEAVAMLGAIRSFTALPASWFDQLTPPWASQTDARPFMLTRFEIEHYRRHHGVRLLDLGRVNLIVGVNNTGKTSVLEALHLLARQTDPSGLFEVIRLRTRFEGQPDPAWLLEQVPQQVILRGWGASTEVSSSIAKEPAPPNGRLQGQHLATVVITGMIGEEMATSRTELYAGGYRRGEFAKNGKWLCRSTLHSPFSLADRDALERANRASIEEKSKATVIEFLREHVDSGLRGIELADRFARFLVTHDDFPEAVDLSVFGQGLQRIFQVALLFAANRGGLVLIDEFENAIHADLLVTFTGFIQELAVKHDVQVFLTTHSKEAIDAFVREGESNEDVVAFTLHRDSSEVRRFAGPQLARAIETVDLDIRRL